MRYSDMIKIIKEFKKEQSKIMETQENHSHILDKILKKLDTLEANTDNGITYNTEAD